MYIELSYITYTWNSPAGDSIMQLAWSTWQKVTQVTSKMTKKSWHMSTQLVLL